MDHLSTRMKKKFFARSRLLAAVALVGVFSAALPFSAFAEKGDLQTIEASVQKHTPVFVPLGKAELIDVDGDIADVMVANSNVIDVTAVQSNRLYVVGLSVGDTNIIALDADGNVIRKIDIHVKYDLDAIQGLVNELFPDENVKVGSIHDQILLSGTASTPEKAAKIANIVAHYVSDLQDEDGKSIDELVSNLLEVKGEQQVSLQVRIVEASRNIIKELGIETAGNDLDELSATRLFGRFPPSSMGSAGRAGFFGPGGGTGLSQDPVGLLSLLADTGIDGIGDINVVLNALEDENLVNILAEPNLTAVSGEQAGFLAGGEFPVPVGRDQTGNIVIEFREFGVSLNFRPTVLSSERIALQMNTEVSSLDFDNAVVLADLTVPGLDVRKAETSVEIPSGGTLMIAGLLQSKAVKGMSGLPGIRKTPVLGKLLSSDSFQREETELLVFITPYLVEPVANKTTAEQITKEVSNPLAIAYKQNINRAYAIKEDEIFAGDEPYGYILE
jgi:pilus assembly protein CpaC